MTPPPDVQQVVRDGTWLAHRYDPEGDAFHFMRLTRDDHRSATFLTDEYLPNGRPVTIIGRQAAIDALPPLHAPHFIFHSAFCCSTLLARAFDIPGVAMGLKEPPVFNDIVGWRHRGGGPPARIAQVLDQATRLLDRPLGVGETNIVKPSNVSNGLARGIMTMNRGSRALLLHAPLGIYLRSIAKKEMTGRLWVRDLLVKLLRDGLVDLGFSTEDYMGQTDLQVAAVGWLAQQTLFARIASEFGPDRVRTLDSEALLAAPLEVMRALGSFFDLSLSDSQWQSVTEGPAFAQHSKHRAHFDARARNAEYDAAAAAHLDELEKVEVWAHAVAEAAGVSPVLPNPIYWAP